MKIGISGTQSVGKTTLLNALTELEQFRYYSVCNEVTRWVKGLGLEINESGNDSTQQLIMMKHIYNVFMHYNMITDRTALDGLVYTKWLHDKGAVSRNTFIECQMVFEKLIDEYDRIFFIKPEFDVEDDGVRSINVEFRDEIQSLFEYYIEMFDVKIIPISGTVEERVAQVLKGIENE